MNNACLRGKIIDKKTEEAMFKGYQKQMIVLRGTGSEIFDEVHFILKKGGESSNRYGSEQKYSRSEQSAMLLEANRIIEENRLGNKSRSQGYYAARYALLFTLGFILGAAFILLALAIS